MWEKVLAAGTMVVGLTVAVVGGIIVSKTNKLSNTFDRSVKDLEKTAENDIAEKLIGTAVENAARRKVNDYVDRVGDSVMADGKQKISDEVRKAVANAKQEIADKVTERIGAEAAMIDMDDLKKSARAKAEAKIVDKFDGNLDDLLEKFGDNLSNVKRIYSSIADAMSSQSKSKEIKFSLD